MQQMLQALMNGGQGDGAGDGGSKGAGGGGTGSSGSRMQGYMRQNLPIFGPTRVEYDMASLAYGEYASGKGRTRGKGDRAIDTSLHGSDNVDGSDNVLAKDAVPMKYKEAVKKYFSDKN